MKKHKFMENLSLKVIALFFAVFLWLIVMNIDDPVDTQTFDNIPVEVKNEQVVKSKGKTYRVLEGTENVSVKVTAKREILEKLTSSDFSAVADMQEMQINSLIPIKVSVKRYSNECTAEASPNNLVVEISDVKQKVFPLTVSVSGTPQNGCIIGNMTVNPEKITIKGSEPLVESIEKAVVKVDVTGRAESGTVQGNLVLYDSQGNIVDQSKLSNNLNTETGIQVEIQMLNTKEVPIVYEQPTSLKENYIVTGWTCEPQTIQISGTKVALDGVSEIEIPASEIDVSDATKKVEKTVGIEQYLPEGIGLVEENANTILITVMIEKEGSRMIEFPVEGIRVNNLKDKYELLFESDEVIELKFIGEQTILDQLDITNAVSIDLQSCKAAGEYEIPVSIEVPDGVEVEKQLTIKVKLTEKKDDTSQTADQRENSTQEESEK